MLNHKLPYKYLLLLVIFFKHQLLTLQQKLGFNKKKYMLRGKKMLLGRIDYYKLVIFKLLLVYMAEPEIA